MRRSKRRWYAGWINVFTICGLLGSALPVLGQEGGIAGRVSDEEGRPLIAASVVLRKGGRPHYGVATDRSGKFRMVDVEAGRYELVVSYVGYAPAQSAVEIQPDRLVQEEVMLQPRAIAQHEVVVTASRARHTVHPITFSNMTAQELEEQPSMKDLPAVLSLLPSITHYSENGNDIGYSTMRMRGFDQRRVAVAVNGIPQNDPEDFNVFWINFFDLQGATEDIQVQRGAGASFYGPTAIGGAVNIVARPYRPYPFAEAEVGYGAHNTRRFTIEGNSGLLGQRYVAFGRLSRLLSDGYRDWSWTRFYRFFTGVTRYGERSLLTLQAYGGPQRDGLAFSGIPKGANERTIEDPFGNEIDRRYNFSAFTEDREFFHQPHVELLHEWDLSQAARFHQALFWVKGEGYFDFGATFRSADYLRLPESFRDLSSDERRLPLFVVAPDASVLFRAYLDQWQAGWLPYVTLRHGRSETTVGGELRLHRSLRWGRIEEAAGIPGSLVGADDDVRVYSFRGEKVIGSIYARSMSRVSAVLAVQADIQLTYRRYRVYDEAFFNHEFTKPYAFVNPRLGVTLFPDQPFSAYVSLALAHREPRLKSLYDGEEAGAGFQPRFERDDAGEFDYDRPEVTRERLVNGELGVLARGRAWSLAANLYWMEFDDEIVPSGGLDQFGVPRSGNAERTRHLGLEIEADLRPARWLGLYGNATLSRNRFVDFAEFITRTDGQVLRIRRDGNTIAGFPERVAKAGVRFAVRDAMLRFEAKFAGQQFVDNSGGVALNDTPRNELLVDPYLLVNATLQYEPDVLPGLRLSFDAGNLLDSRILLYGNVGPAGPQFFPAARRHLFVSARYRLQ